MGWNKELGAEPLWYENVEHCAELDIDYAVIMLVIQSFMLRHEPNHGSICEEKFWLLFLGVVSKCKRAT